MKKALLTLCFVLGLQLIAASQNWVLNAYQYAYKTRTAYGWTDWTNWIDTYVKITVSPNYIHIYSQQQQQYRILQLLEVDGSVWKWQCVDYANNYCNIRFKTDDKQLYVDYPHLAWVYNFQ